MNFAGGEKYSSSRQWTAISASETSTSGAAVPVCIAIASISLLVEFESAHSPTDKTKGFLREANHGA
jgi:hypothetical protein